jgi:outer membrane protein, heavy metal efflux system
VTIDRDQRRRDAAPARRPALAPLSGTLLALALLVGGGLAAAQPLEAYLARSERAIGVVTALLERDDAEVALGRSRADPLALRPELVQAQQRADLSAAQAQEALFEAYAEVAAAYAQVREAELQLRLARAGRELAARGLEVARLRFERGSATALEVQSAETDLREAERGVNAASDGLALATSNLVGLTGLAFEESEPLGRERLAALQVPSDDELAAAAERTPTVMQVRHGLALAELQVELLDPSFAARSQIDQARLQRDRASAAADEARRGVTLLLRSRANALATALEGDRIAQEALAQAHEREAIERQRLQAGLISELAFEQAQLQTLQAELRAVQAEHALVRAALELQAATLAPLEGWHAF